MREEQTNKAYESAKDIYAGYGIDTDTVLYRFSNMELSLPCWQGDDMAGFEKSGEALSGGIMVTGKYPGRARTGDDLRSDMKKAMSLIPGRMRANVHAMYMESDKKIERNEIEPRHFIKWIEWAKNNSLGLDFNPTAFSHPKAASGYTLSDIDGDIREYWVEHCIRCREIAEYIGKETGKVCINNLWIPDGCKDITPLRLKRRELLLESCDRIFKRKFINNYMHDSVESKLFGIGSESFVVGSHEFYLGYAIKNTILITFDTGHFHPTESIADKISTVILFVPGILLHISRGVRWDSDHIPILSDDIAVIFQEIKRSEAYEKTHFALDFFDGSVNHIFAWIIGARAAMKAILISLLEPTELIVKAEMDGDFGKRLALLEEFKNLPWSAVWEMACLQKNIPSGNLWIEEVSKYERDVLSKRS